MERAIQVEEDDIERGHRLPGALGKSHQEDVGEQSASLQAENQSCQGTQEGGAESHAGEVVEFGFDDEGERQPLMVELEHNGGGGKRGVEEHGGLPSAGVGADDGAAEIEHGGSGGQLPDVVGGGVAPFARGEREKAERIERQQPGTGRSRSKASKINQ